MYQKSTHSDIVDWVKTGRSADQTGDLPQKRALKKQVAPLYELIWCIKDTNGCAKLSYGGDRPRRYFYHALAKTR